MQFVRFAGTAEGLQRFAHPVIRQLQTAGPPPLLRIHPEALPLEESPGRFADLRRDPHGPRLPGEPFDGGIERRGHSAPLEILVDEEHVHIPPPPSAEANPVIFPRASSATKQRCRANSSRQCVSPSPHDAQSATSSAV